jgi:regulator of replication initiation timing
MTDEKQLTTMEQFSNEILKEVFQELHSDVVDNINTSSVIDRLFCARVLSANDMHDLDLINHRIDKCRRLLIMLHKSKNPRAFVELRRSIDDEMSYDWLVKEIDEKCKFAASAAGAESRVARDHSNPTLTALDADVDDVTGLNRVMDDLRRENGTLMTENRRLKDDIERMSLERSAYEKNMINVVDVLKQKLKQIEKERDDLRRWKDDSLSIRRGNDMFPTVIDERSQIPVHLKKANESESVFIEYNGNDDVVGIGNGAPDRDRDMMTSALGELRRDAWELHVDGAQTPPVLRSPKADRKELPPVGASQHQVVPVGGQPIPTVVFVDETTSTTWSITPGKSIVFFFVCMKLKV